VWETEPDHQARFADAIADATTGAIADDWQQVEVLRSADRSRVTWFGRAAMPTDVALIRGRKFQQSIIERVDQTGARMLEARSLLPAGSFGAMQ